MSDLPPIEFSFPDLRKWEKGAAPYVHVLESGRAGPTVMVASLTHGNEVSGAVVVDALLSAGLKPRRGTLIFSFNNIDAYHSFDPRSPFKSRMIDEDFNRTWGRLDQPATTSETRRAQTVRPFVERADLLLDLNFNAKTEGFLRIVRELAEMDLMWIPVCRSWRLNERHYGALQGLNKRDTVEKFGMEQVHIWRRS